MRGIITLLIVTIFCGCAAHAQPVCRADRLEISPGGYLITSSGQKYQLFPGNELNVSGSWLPLDHLRICRLGGNADEITNLDRRGEQIEGLNLN
jgi:hypothetical protein